MFHDHLSAKILARTFTSGERASVAVSSALAIPALLGVAGLAIEFGDALVTRAETQRVADLAVHAGILAFSRNGNAEAMTNAAQNVAQLNGVAPDQTLVMLDSNGAAGPVVRVTITTPRPLVLSRMISANQSLDVTVRSAAGMTQTKGEPPCIMALDPNGPGITLNGGTSITAADCSVVSNAQVSIVDGATITTETVYYDSDTEPNAGAILSPSGGTARIMRTNTPDPFAAHAAIALAQSRLEIVAAMQGPPMPTATFAPDITFNHDNTATQQQALAVGCTASRSGDIWSFGCPSGSTVDIGRLTITGGLTLDFAPDGTGNTTYNILGGIFSDGGTTSRFGAGTYRVARASGGCGGSVRYSICNTATMSFDGPVVFELQGGVRNSDGASLRLGTGQHNSYRIGPASNGEALTLLGGSTTILADADGPDSKFEALGNIRSEGGTCFVIGAAANHDIAGYLDLKGAAIFGSGVYTIDGYLHLGAAWGGSAQCLGTSVSMRALDVTFVLSGKGVPGANFNCNGQAAFCAASGYNSMQLVAPSTGPFANMAMIGPLMADMTAGASFAGGASDSQISGALYFPNGPVTLSGGAGAGGSSAGCLQIIGANVRMTGGTTTTSECVTAGEGTSVARVRMIE